MHHANRWLCLQKRQHSSQKISPTVILTLVTSCKIILSDLVPLESLLLNNNGKCMTLCQVLIKKLFGESQLQFLSKFNHSTITPGSQYYFKFSCPSRLLTGTSVTDEDINKAHTACIPYKAWCVKCYPAHEALWTV